MEEQVRSFETRLKDLVTFANENKGVIEVDKVNDFFKELKQEIVREGKEVIPLGNMIDDTIENQIAILTQEIEKNNGITLNQLK